MVDKTNTTTTQLPVVTTQTSPAVFMHGTAEQFKKAVMEEMLEEV